ncbi:MAG: hypothetical protein IVW55_06300 [Chloroflexi bacterium]|nr:hypothetical protein [Chloroflexota bacterium]
MTGHRSKTSRRFSSWLLASALISLLPLLAAQPSPSSAAPVAFADNAFQRIWERTDAPVLSGQTQRSWYWGPQPGITRNEPYSGSKSGTRLVQYFDKARMEINNPAGDRSSQWFVTTGLLVAEMVSGKEQVGDKSFVPRQPAEIAVGGDGLLADPDAPTYTSFRPMASLTGPGANRAPQRTGQPVTATINRAGQVGDNPSLALYPGTKIAAYSDVLGHNIPQAMWDFLNLKGVVEQNGATQSGQTLANWVFTMGYPITEPYWARMKIGGIYYDVMFQMYERRSLAYIPSFPKGWQVQMGNVGRDYYRWLYGGPLPSPVVPLGAPAPPPQPPANIDATINPATAASGATLTASLSGFRPGEAIASWFTGPGGDASDARINLKAAEDGTVGDVSIPTAGLGAGVWAITFHGRASNHESVAYFTLTPSSATATPTDAAQQPTSTEPAGATAVATSTRVPTHAAQGSPTPTPTMPNVPTEPPSGFVLAVSPGYGSPSGQFTFSASGLNAGEQAQVQFTDPTGAVVYPAGSNNGLYTADGAGNVIFSLVPAQAFPAAPTGVWLFELRGLRSGLDGVIGFTLQ